MNLEQVLQALKGELAGMQLLDTGQQVIALRRCRFLADTAIELAKFGPDAAVVIVEPQPQTPE